jgi:hypothetical protein
MEANVDLTVEIVEEVLGSFFRRCELIRLAGGIALQDAVNETAIAPPGWVLDEQTYYYVPPGFDPTTTSQ